MKEKPLMVAAVLWSSVLTDQSHQNFWNPLTPSLTNSKYKCDVWHEYTRIAFLQWNFRYQIRIIKFMYENY